MFALCAEALYIPPLQLINQYNGGFFMFLFKKIAALFVFAALSAVAAAKEQYQFVVIGDLHYDAADVRVDADKLTGARKRGMDSNIQAWKTNIPNVLKAAARYAAQDNVLFTVQCGDITQGDEGSYELACTSFERALKYVTKDQKKPLYLVRGNHDIGGKGKLQACDDILFGYMKKQDVIYPLPGKDQTCYKVVDKDLFIFFDSLKGSFEAVNSIFKANPDVRHVFFFTHLPVMPCRFVADGLGWICGKADKFDYKLRKLLAKHNTVVLSAHTHQTAYFQWKMPEGSIRQFVSFSIVNNSRAKIEKISGSGDKYFQDFEKYIFPKLPEKRRAAEQRFMKDFAGKLEFYNVYKNVNGFNVLRVEGDHVFVDMYCGKLDKAVFTQQIK